MSLCDYVSVCICLCEYVCFCISVYVCVHEFGSMMQIVTGEI